MITEEEYLELCEIPEDEIRTGQVDEKRRYEEHKLFNKNASAVMAAVNEQQNKLGEMQEKVTNVLNQLAMVQHDLNKLKQESMMELIEKLGNGPTTLEE